MWASRAKRSQKDLLPCENAHQTDHHYLLDCPATGGGAQEVHVIRVGERIQNTGDTVVTPESGQATVRFHREDGEVQRRLRDHGNTETKGERPIREEEGSTEDYIGETRTAASNFLLHFIIFISYFTYYLHTTATKGRTAKPVLIIKQHIYNCIQHPRIY